MPGYSSIKALDGEGEFDAYVAQPEHAPIGAIVVIQEIFGVNEGIRRKCDRWAKAGYVAVAPDLFWRIAPRIELNPDIPAQLQQGLSYMDHFDQNLAITDIEATIKTARLLSDGGKVGVVGYCLGGRLAFMAACRTDGDAFVGYYGVGIDGLLNEQAAIGKPVLLHIPTADGFVSPETQQAMHEGLSNNAHVTMFDYPGLDHGFATEMGDRRDDAGARLADGRTFDFFAKALA